MYFNVSMSAGGDRSRLSPLTLESICLQALTDSMQIMPQSAYIDGAIAKTEAAPTIELIDQLLCKLILQSQGLRAVR